VRVVGEADHETGEVEQHELENRHYERATGEAIASAMVDRIVHHSEVIDLNGGSYRRKSHQSPTATTERDHDQWSCL
jgi:hypothetical protein